ncbi:MAG: glucose PTS transporter subunit IIA [Eubacterium sp.]|nr:glucose PTS transporter subunit IIA [Eubacterium sp.]
MAKTKKKDSGGGAFSVLQRVGRSFMLPISILPVAGLLLGLGSTFTNETTIATYHLEHVLGAGTILHALMVIMNAVGSVVFNNLPLLFAVGVAIGMAKKEKEVAALASMIAFFVMNISINAMLQINGQIDAAGNVIGNLREGSTQSIVGITTLQMGVFGGIIVGLGVAALHNRFYKIELPAAISFFSGSRFVPIISTVVYLFVGILMYFVWPIVQTGINSLGGLVTSSGYVGTLIFGLIKRALIPFGLHHVFYMPFWQTAVGGTMEVAGQVYEGGQNIFFAQLAHSADITHFSADACRYFSGEFIFMIFGLPGAALAMYRTAKPEKKKQAGGLLLSASLACAFTGITEPLEFSFLFVAPILFVVQVILAGTCYMIAHILNIAVGLTFSGGLIDLILFGVMQGNAKTSWLRIIPVGIIYFFLYYFIFKFLILKLNLKTPGREDDDVETRLFTKADYKAKQAGEEAGGSADSTIAALSEEDLLSDTIMKGLGGKANISDVDACATRLRCTVINSDLVSDPMLKATGASGVVHHGEGIQVIYGPRVAVIKSNLEDYLEKVPSTEFMPEGSPAAAAQAASGTSTSDAVKETNTSAGATAEDAASSESEAKKPAGKLVKTVIIGSPIKGQADDLSTCPDDGFAQGMMGLGMVVTPEDPVVTAPADGEIEFVFDTRHAIGFTTEDGGLSLLIHIGIDTVKLGGKGFEVLVEAGQKIKKGEPLMKVDIDYIKENAPSIVSPVLLADVDEDHQVVRPLHTGKVNTGDDLFAVDIYE